MISGFYGIIPTYVRHNKKIQPNAKVLYAEITATLDNNGACSKRNAYFSKILDVTATTISNLLKNLRDQNAVAIIHEHEEETQQFKKRYIIPTYLNSVKEVCDAFDLPYLNKIDGVSDDSSQRDALDESNQLNTLLYNNNNTIKLYTSKDKNPKVELYSTITDGQKEFLFAIVNKFYKAKKEQSWITKALRNWESDTDLINGSVNTLYDLIIKDEYDQKVVSDVVDFATHDKFWARNLFSLRTLRDTSANGISKFANIYKQFLK